MVDEEEMDKEKRARWLSDTTTLNKNNKSDGLFTKKDLIILNVLPENYEDWKKRYDIKQFVEKTKHQIKEWANSWKDDRGRVLQELKEYAENYKTYTKSELEEWLKDEIKNNKELEKEKDILKLKKDDKPTDEFVFTRRGQLETFYGQQPFYFNKSKMFYLWNKENSTFDLSDEIDFCNLIYKKLGINTIQKNDRIELVEGFKQVGRIHKPKDMIKSWVQFKNKIYDVKTDDNFEATPDYFVTNPIPFKIGDSEDTPTIDKLFSEWVEPEYVNTLYEIVAYSICMDKFMQRIIALCGGGANGKGTFIKLLFKFLGVDNCVSSEIKNLSEDKFEPAVLYKKLLCVGGEVSYDDLKNTNMLKKLGGEDKISFQFKGKTPFTDDNTATCIFLTNSMPITPDKSMGFYRKWLIIDFPNQFKQVNKNLIEDIPEVEFENLAKKCLRILKELYETQKFTNEGDFEERARKYEEHSNPVMKFVDEDCNEEAGTMTTLRDFTNACNEFLKSRHLRIMTANQIGKVLRDEGFIVGHRKINDVSAVVIVNLLIKTTKTTRTTQSSICSLYKEKNREMSSSSSNNGFEGEKDKNKIFGNLCNIGNIPPPSHVRVCNNIGVDTLQTLPMLPKNDDSLDIQPIKPQEFLKTENKGVWSSERIKQAQDKKMKELGFDLL